MTVRHPIRGFFSGLLLGIGLALVMVQLSFVPFGAATVIVVIAAGVVVGVAFAMLMPVRGAGDMPTAPPPARGPELNRLPPDD